jgi:predicted esterase YcpF (UPF0227 family)
MLQQICDLGAVIIQPAVRPLTNLRVMIIDISSTSKVGHYKYGFQ